MGRRIGKQAVRCLGGILGWKCGCSKWKDALSGGRTAEKRTGQARSERRASWLRWAHFGSGETWRGWPAGQPECTAGMYREDGRHAGYNERRATFTKCCLLKCTGVFKDNWRLVILPLLRGFNSTWFISIDWIDQLFYFTE